MLRFKVIGKITISQKDSIPGNDACSLREFQETPLAARRGKDFAPADLRRPLTKKWPPKRNSECFEKALQCFLLFFSKHFINC